MQPQTKTLRDYMSILRRRRMQFGVVAAIVLAIAVSIAWLLPAVYRSTGTILIEQQEIPQDLVGSTISTFADQRIQVISQQAMSRASLAKIVEKYGLYGTRTAGAASSGAVERLRKSINLDLLKADITDRSGNRTTATIAFTLSYDGENAQLSQEVATELVGLFLNANRKERQEQAAETSAFLAAEAAKLSEKISESESRLAAFKARNIGRLPEQVQANLQQKDRAENDLKEAERQITVLEGRRFELEAQLAQVKPTLPLTGANGERILDASERLTMLETKYAGMSGVYSESHPDMIKMAREIEALKKGTAASAEQEVKAKQLARLRADLSVARDKYSEDHPDVIRLKKSISALEAAAAVAAEPPGRAVKAENPAFITLKSQLDAVNSELKGLRAKRAELRVAVVELDSRLAHTPQVERDYLVLTRDRENLVRHYEELRGKQMQAQMAQEMEGSSKAERFLLLDPPQLPEQPRSPNRVAILFLGFLLSLGSGAAYAGAREALDDSIHQKSDLIAASDVPVLGLIPYIDNERDDSQFRRLRRLPSPSLFLVAALAATLQVVAIEGGQTYVSASDHLSSTTSMVVLP